MIYYTVYKITNTINNMIYIGSHKTRNINDNYYGSGRKIKEAIKEYGRINFKKEILSFHSSNEEMLIEEKRLVNKEFIERIDTYNLIIGGGFNTADTVLVENEQGKCFRIDKNDIDYINGKYKNPNKDKIMVTDGINNFKVYKTDERYITGELYTLNKNKILVVNELGENIWIFNSDDKFLNGTYKHVSKGRKANKECIEKLKQIPHNGKNNPMFGKSFITNKESGISKAVLKNEIDYYLDNGWYLGRPKNKTNNQYGTKWLYNDMLKTSKQIKIVEIDFYLNNGWLLGRKKYE